MDVTYISDTVLEGVVGGMGNSIMVYNEVTGAFTQHLELVAKADAVAKTYTITRGPAADSINLNGAQGLSK